MKRIGLLVMAALLLMGTLMAAQADIYNSLGANTTQEYKVKLQEGTYTVEFAAPGTGWQADVTYICHS
jgi:hypothetical protein